MVRVPDYQPDVKLRPAFRQDIDVRATPEAFGADIGRGMQAAAKGLGDLGDAFAKVQALRDETEARQRRNQYMTERDAILYDPETGYMNTEGKNALDGRKDAELRLRQARERYAKGLSPAAARMYGQAADALDLETNRTMLRHNGAQLKAYVVQEGEAGAANFQNEALRHAGDPKMADKYMAAGLAEKREVARKKGMSPEAIDLMERSYVSETTRKTAQQLAVHDPLAADAYVKKNAGRLSADDRLELDKALKAPVLAAKAKRNLAEWTGAIPAQRYEPQDLRDAPGDDPSAPQSFERITSRLMGMHEARNTAAISEFIKRSAGISINPRVTPWCAAFVNAVLGAQGIKGTGKLNARSFLNFGLPTESPKLGDIVVLTRGGNSWQGHVGFFQGFDENGNIRVLGGNQGNAVNVTTYGADKLLGFRTAGKVDENVAALPNYGPQGLAAISERLAGIADPEEREATRKVLDTYYAARKKQIDAHREQVESWASTQIMQDPTFDPMKMPLDLQSALGASGMTTLLNYQQKVRTAGEPQTDERVLYDLQTQYADDPEAFGAIDLFQHRDKLSNADWKKVNDWRETSRRDRRKARDESLTLSRAFSLASSQLEAVGFTTTGKTGSARDNAAREIARFNTVLADQMDAFRHAAGKAPTDSETMSMINRLLLPIVIKTPGALWGEWATSGKHLFQAGTRPDNSTVEVAVEYADVPIDRRRRIAADLEQELGRKPSQAEVARRYGEVELGRFTDRK